MDHEIPRFDLPDTFRPVPWLSGHHRQTLAARLLRPSSGVPFYRERIATPDDDFLDLDFPFVGPDTPPDRFVLVLHGLEGSARSKYALQTYRELHRRNLRAVGLNFRSCSGEVNRQPRLYHSGETSDLDFVLTVLHERWPGVVCGVVGFSLGGNVLLKYLAEQGERARVDAAVAVSVPYDLGAGADYLETHGRLYLSFLLRKLRRKTREKRAVIEHLIDVERALRSRTFREFDDAATAPLHGFADADDYYTRSSSGPRLSAVRTPALLIHSRDDPFMPPGALPVEEINANPWLTPSFSDRGGHVGFLAGSVWRPVFWAEQQVAACLDRALPAG